MTNQAALPMKGPKRRFNLPLSNNIDVSYLLSLSRVTYLHIFVRIATQCIFFFPKFFISLPWLQTTCCVVQAQVFLSLFYLFFLLTNHIYVHIGLSTTTRLARVANVATTTTMPQRNGREGSWWCNGPKRCIVFFFFLFLIPFTNYIYVSLSTTANDKCRHHYDTTSRWCQWGSGLFWRWQPSARRRRGWWGNERGCRGGMLYVFFPFSFVFILLTFFRYNALIFNSHHLFAWWRWQEAQDPDASRASSKFFFVYFLFFTLLIIIYWSTTTTYHDDDNKQLPWHVQTAVKMRKSRTVRRTNSSNDDEDRGSRRRCVLSPWYVFLFILLF